MIGAPPKRTVPLTPGQHRRWTIVLLISLVVVAGLVAWAAEAGNADRSHAGCVTVNFPSSTGGALMHACGAAAKAWCASEYKLHGSDAELVQKQCRLAGIGPS